MIRQEYVTEYGLADYQVLQNQTSLRMREYEMGRITFEWTVEFIMCRDQTSMAMFEAQADVVPHYYGGLPWVLV